MLQATKQNAGEAGLDIVYKAGMVRGEKIGIFILTTLQF